MTLITAFGIIGNVLVVVLFTKHKSLQTRTTKLLTSLAVSDGTMAAIGALYFTINCFSHTQAISLDGKHVT